MRGRGRLLWLIATFLYAAPSAAQGPKITIATVTAQAGEEVVVPVSLDLGNALFVRGIRNDIFWGPLTPIRELENGQPDCAVDADLVSTVQVGFNATCLEESPEPEEGCVRLRAQLFSGVPPAVG